MTELESRFKINPQTNQYRYEPAVNIVFRFVNDVQRSMFSGLLKK